MTMSRRKMYMATSFGHLVEWYEFSVYGFLAVYVGAVFFPSADSTTQLLATFGVFGLTFCFRPLGALIFGPMADRIGRRPVLVTVLLLMSGSTALIAVIPGFNHIGVWAPLLLILLRALQNLSAGGEFGGVTAFMLEHAKPGRRGYATSWLMFFSTVGFVAGAVIVSGLLAIIGGDAMAEWGWRIPFALAAPLGLIGLYIRFKLEDSPEFLRIAEKGELARSPLREAFAYKRQILTVIGLGGLHSTAFYIILTFMVSYITKSAGFSSGLALGATLGAAAAALVPIPLVALLSDRIGRRPVLLTGSTLLIIAPLPLFALIHSSPVGAIVGQILFGLLLGTYISTTLVSMTEIFPTRVRSAGSSMGFTLASAGIGGIAPFVATWLVKVTGSVLAPAWYVIATAVLALIASLVLRSPSSEAASGDATEDSAPSTVSA